LSKAEKALSNGDFNKAVEYANRVLIIDDKNEKAHAVVATANKRSKLKISRLITEGTNNYNKKNLNRAKKIFNSILNMDANNSAAIIYTKKIERQLKTIQSLQ